MFRLMADFNNFNTNSASNLHNLSNHQLNQSQNLNFNQYNLSENVSLFNHNNHLGTGKPQLNAKSSNKQSPGQQNMSQSHQLQQPHLQQHQQLKNPNRNKKVKDLIIDLRLQQQQQYNHQQQQQIHQIDHNSQFQQSFNYFNDSTSNNCLINQSNQLVDLITGSANNNPSNNYINLDEHHNQHIEHHQDINKLDSSSITLNCLNNTQNSNIDLIQLLNSTNTTIDDSGYNPGHHSQHHSHQLSHLSHLSHQNHYQHQTTEDDISSLSSNSSLSSANSLNHQLNPHHGHHHQIQQHGLQHQLHHQNEIVGICSEPAANPNGLSNQTSQDDDNFILYNILNKLTSTSTHLNQASQISDNHCNNSKLVSNHENLLLLSNSEFVENTNTSSSPSPSSPSSSSSAASTSSTSPSLSSASQKSKSSPQNKLIDSTEYINLLINQAESSQIKSHKLMLNMNQCVNLEQTESSNTYTTLQPANNSSSQSSVALKQEKFDSNFLANSNSGEAANANGNVQENLLDNIDQYLIHQQHQSLITQVPLNSSTPSKSSSDQNGLNNSSSSSQSQVTSSHASESNMMLSVNVDQDKHLNQPIASPTNAQMEEINTKELAHKISSELKRYSIPQAVFAQRVLCRSQGTLSDLLRNPKPWSKLKSGRETFRRMYKWLQEPESQRMNSLRLAAATKRKEDDSDNFNSTNEDQIDEVEEIEKSSNIINSNTLNTINININSNSVINTNPVAIASEDFDNDDDENDDDEDDEDDDDDDYGNMSGDENDSRNMLSPNTNRRNKLMQINQIISDHQLAGQNQPQQQQHHSGHHAKKPRLVFTDIQRRTLQAIFKETKRPSKEMQVTIAQQLGLEVATVSNFFMNARRRSMDKWKDQDDENSNCSSAK